MTKFIMRDSEDAAQLKTVTGWVSSKCRFFGDSEYAARYDGCTNGAWKCVN